MKVAFIVCDYCDSTHGKDDNRLTDTNGFFNVNLEDQRTSVIDSVTAVSMAVYDFLLKETRRNSLEYMAGVQYSLQTYLVFSPLKSPTPPKLRSPRTNHLVGPVVKTSLTRVRYPGSVLVFPVDLFSR